MSTSVDTMKNFFNVLKRYSNDTEISGITVLDNAVRRRMSVQPLCATLAVKLWTARMKTEV